jgi:hypothetical protein
MGVSTLESKTDTSNLPLLKPDKSDTLTGIHAGYTTNEKGAQCCYRLRSEKVTCNSFSRRDKQNRVVTHHIVSLIRKAKEGDAA